MNLNKKSAKLLRTATVVTLLAGLLQPAASLPQAQAADAGRKSLDVRKTLTAPVIDGQLDESLWSISQPLSVQVGQGPFKDSRFGLLWDNQYLYIGVKADDDNLISGASGNWFEQDNINVFLDPTQHQSAPFANDDMQIGFVYKPGTTVPEFHFGAALNGHSGKDEKRILRAISQTGTGWAAEVAVPWDMLNFDPNVKKQLGIELGATDRYGADTAEQRTSYWSAYNSTSFWNDTTGYGTLNLVDSNPVTGSVSPVLLQESFDHVTAGQLPANWISDVNAGSPAFSVVKDTYGNGRITFDGNASAKQSRVVAPVQWDNYIIEADVKFDAFLNTGRWASLMFRAPSSGKPPYAQMAIKQNGTIETAYRKPDGSWTSPITATGSQLVAGKEYTMKVRVFDNNVKNYLKAKTDSAFVLYGNKSLTSDVLPERGSIGLQGDQSKVSFDNVKVTRVTADRLDLTVPSTLEALSGATSVTSSVYYSDGITETPAADHVKLYSSDESIIKIVNNQIYPVKPGKATVKAVYFQAEAVQEITVTPSLTGVKTVTLKHNDGYLLAVANQALDLSQMTLQAEFTDLTSGTITGDQVTWTSDSPNVAFVGGKLTVNKKGVYTITGTKDSAAISVIVVAKDAGDAEYVLYEENFDSLTEGTLPTGWTRKQGTTSSAAVVKSGAFEMNALASPDNPSRVLLPSYLGLFGNYKIEADVTHLAANNTARWHSFMYRIQNHDYPYYQMAVRQDATAANGIEFAERTAANAWNVMDRGSNTEAIDPAKMYHYTVKAYGNRVQESINNKVIIDTDAATAYAKGEIGLQADGSKMRLDNLRVTLQQDALPPIPNGRFAEVSEPDTQIAMAASVVTEIKSADDLAKLSLPAQPSTAIFHIREGLKVTDPTGAKEIGSLDSLLASIEGRFIPAFYVKDEATVDQLTAFLKENVWEDADVISDNGDLIKRARAAYPMIRGILDVKAESSLTPEQLLDIRSQTAASQARIAMLPQSASTREQVAYLQQRMIMVWAKANPGAAAESKVPMHRLITSGVNGIVTDSPTAAWDALKVYSNHTTLIRKPYIIAHRGMPSTSPENTIESNRLGLEAGAEFIENDMYLSKDGRIMILHDGSLERTTNGTGNIENYTFAELKQLNANKPYPNGYPDVKIPTLDEQIDLAKEKGAMVMAEIKTSTPAAVDAYVKLLKEKNAVGVVDTMSFDANQLKRMAELMPEMPLGLLSGGYANEANVSKSLRETLKLLQGLNASYNSSYSGIGPKFMEASKHRGLIISPWTFNNKDVFIQFMNMGAFGITTDYSYWASDWAASIRPEKETYELAVDGSVSLSAIVKSYKGTETNVEPSIIVLDGQDTVEVSGTKVTARKSGTAHALLRYTASFDANNPYDIYTQPITITVAGQDGNGGNNGGNNGGEGGTGGGHKNHNNSGGTTAEVPAEVPAPTPASAVVVAKEGKAEAAELKQALGAHDKVQVQFKGDSVELAAAGIAEAIQANGKTLQVTGDNGSVSLPLSALKLEALAQQLGMGVNELKLRFTANKLGELEAGAMHSAVAAIGGKPVSGTVRLAVEAVSPAGQSVPVTMDPQSVTREIKLDQPVDPGKATVVQLIPGTKQLRFVPALFAMKDGSMTAVLKGNGTVFMIVENNKSFADLANHWAKADVELLANKLVVDGAAENRFDPDRHMTRAEFAALLVRALGLDPASGEASFSDVKAADWYAAPVAAAASAGLLGGYEDGSFRPNKGITREEQAAMMVRAMAYAGIDASVSPAKQDEALAAFKDAKQIVWAKAEVAAALQAGLLNGMTADTLDSASYATRAQSAVMLKRLLSKVNYIN